MKHKAEDYIEYNQRYGYNHYGYLHRILDLIYKIHIIYNIKTKNIVYWINQDSGNQGEIKGTEFEPVTVRIKKHKKLLLKMLKKRHKNWEINRQLNIFYDIKVNK